MNNNIECRVKNIISAVFGIPIEGIGDESSTDTIESWDSLKHINMIVALEEEFNLEFTDDNITEMINMKLILAVLSEKFSENNRPG